MNKNSKPTAAAKPTMQNYRRLVSERVERMTAAAKHTPGPWSFVSYEPESPHLEVRRQWDETVSPGNTDTFGSSLGAHICGIDYTRSGVATLAQANANARLIAAAPDMLDALRDVLNMHAMDGHMQGTFYRDATGAMQRARAAIARATGD